MKKLTKIRPRSKQVLVRVDEEKARESEFGIITPSNVEQEKERTAGTIVSVGPEIKDLKKGDRVIYGAYAGEQLKLDQTSAQKFDHVLLFDEDILAVIEE